MSKESVCYFHYTQDILGNKRVYGLYKKENRNTNDKILNKL